MIRIFRLENSDKFLFHLRLLIDSNEALSTLAEMLNGLDDFEWDNEVFGGNLRSLLIML